MTTVFIRGRSVEAYYGGALVLVLHPRPEELTEAVQRAAALLADLDGKRPKISQCAA